MFRGRLTAMSAAVLVVSLISVPAAHAGPRVDGTGNPLCNVAGSARFSPKLVDGGTHPTVVKIRGTLYACRPAIAAEGPLALNGVTTGTIKARFTLPTNDCRTALNTGYHSNNDATFTVKWRGTTRLEPSYVTSGSADLELFPEQVAGAGASYVGDFHMPGVNGATSATGSFKSSFLNFVGRLAGSDVQVQTSCTPKAAHVAGGGGLRTLPLLSARSSVIPAG